MWFLLICIFVCHEIVFILNSIGLDRYRWENSQLYSSILSRCLFFSFWSVVNYYNKLLFDQKPAKILHQLTRQIDLTFLTGAFVWNGKFSSKPGFSLEPLALLETSGSKRQISLVVSRTLAACWCCYPLPKLATYRLVYTLVMLCGIQ
jgi:hypothetical protein